MRSAGGRTLIAAGVAGWLLTSCTSYDLSMGDTPKRNTPPRGAVTVQRQGEDTLRNREPGGLAVVRAAPVVGWTGPGGQPFEVALRTTDVESGHARRFGTITLRITLRGNSPDLVQYPCTSCHFGRTVAMKDDRIGDAHQNIQPRHPALLGSVCSTCHSPDAVDMLALKTGERAHLERSYRLCAQCHFSQAEDWAAGAHGKRLDGWQGRRVVMGCTDCHDPHRPAVLQRIPFRAPTIHRGGGHD